MNPHSPVSPLALGVLVVVILGGLVFGVKVFKENSTLKTELKDLRAVSSPDAPSSDTPASVEATRISAEIEKENALKSAAESKAIEIGKSLPRMSDQEWRSLGRVEELGRQAADFIRTFADTIGRMKQGAVTNDNEADVFMQQIMAWMKRLEAIGEMEDDPAEIAQLHAATIGARTKLDAATLGRVREQIEQEFTTLGEQKLARPQRPDSERDDWYLRRRNALNEATQRIEALIPAAQRVEFAVGQSLHLGTGMRTKTELRPDGHGSVTMGFDLPGIDWKF